MGCTCCKPTTAQDAFERSLRNLIKRMDQRIDTAIHSGDARVNFSYISKGMKPRVAAHYRNLGYQVIQGQMKVPHYDNDGKTTMEERDVFIVSWSSQ